MKINDGVKTKLKIIKEIKREPHHKGAGRVVLVVCECGRQMERVYSYVKRGRIKSCRACQSKKHSLDLKRIATERGLRHKRISRIWNNIKTRCLNKKTASYKNYGGRGVNICDEWKNSSSAFEAWAFSSGYSDDLSIDRIDNDGNYEPGNCRWVNSRTQALNSRVRADSTTGVRCVTPIRGKFQLTIDGNYHGVFHSISEAKEKRDYLLKNREERII